MSNSSSLTQAASGGSAETQASANVSAKHGLWGWPLRSAPTEPPKPSSDLSATGSGSSAISSSPSAVLGKPATNLSVAGAGASQLSSSLPVDAGKASADASIVGSGSSAISSSPSVIAGKPVTDFSVAGAGSSKLSSSLPVDAGKASADSSLYGSGSSGLDPSLQTVPGKPSTDLPVAGIGSQLASSLPVDAGKASADPSIAGYGSPALQSSWPAAAGKAFPDPTVADKAAESRLSALDPSLSAATGQSFADLPSAGAGSQLASSLPVDAGKASADPLIGGYGSSVPQASLPAADGNAIIDPAVAGPVPESGLSTLPSSLSGVAGKLSRTFSGAGVESSAPPSSLPVASSEPSTDPATAESRYGTPVWSSFPLVVPGRAPTDPSNDGSELYPPVSSLPVPGKPFTNLANDGSELSALPSSLPDVPGRASSNLPNGGSGLSPLNSSLPDVPGRASINLPNGESELSSLPSSLPDAPGEAFTNFPNDESGLSPLPSSLPVDSGVDNSSLIKPDTTELKTPAFPSTPKPTRVNSGKLAATPGIEPERNFSDSKLPQDSSSTEDPNEPELPFFDANTVNPDNAVDTSDLQSIANIPNAKSLPSVADQKIPQRTWPPVSRTRSQTNGLDSAISEDALASSGVRSSGSTPSTRRPSRIWPPVSSVLASLNPRKSIGVEDTNSTLPDQGGAIANQATLPSDLIKSDRIGDEVGGRVNKSNPPAPRITEAIESLRAQAGNGLPIRDTPSLAQPSIASRTPSSKETEGVQYPQRLPSVTPPAASALSPVRETNPDIGGKVPAPTGNISDAPKKTSKIVPREVEQNPWDHQSIVDTDNAGQVSAEPVLNNSSRRGSRFVEEIPQQAPSISWNDTRLNEKDPKLSDFQNFKNDKKVKFATPDKDDTSSGTVTPFDQVDRQPERSVAEELGSLDPDTGLQAQIEAKEYSQLASNAALPAQIAAQDGSQLDSNTLQAQAAARRYSLSNSDPSAALRAQIAAQEGPQLDSEASLQAQVAAKSGSLSNSDPSAALRAQIAAQEGLQLDSEASLQAQVAAKRGSLSNSDPSAALRAQIAAQEGSQLDPEASLQAQAAAKRVSLSNSDPGAALRAQIADREDSLLELKAALRAQLEAKQQLPPAISTAGNEVTKPDHYQPLQGTAISPEGGLARSAAVIEDVVSPEDLRRLPGLVKSKDASKASWSADESPNERNIRSTVPVNSEASFSGPNPFAQGADEGENLFEAKTGATSEDDAASFVTVLTHADRSGSVGKVLNVNIGVQAEAQASGGQGTSKDAPEPGITRAVIEIPQSQTTIIKLPLPKITVQNPSDATEVDVPPVRRVSISRRDSIPRSLQSATQRPEIRRSLSSKRSSGLLNTLAEKDDVTIEAALKAQATAEEPQLPPVKKGKLYLRKARNAAARPVILNATLGRDVAKYAKPALQRLAKGEHLNFDDAASCFSGTKTEKSLA